MPEPIENVVAANEAYRVRLGDLTREVMQLRAEVEQLYKDLKISDDVLRMTSRRESELEAEVEQLRQELADAHSAHAAVAELLREAYESQPDALDSDEMKALPF